MLYILFMEDDPERSHLRDELAEAHGAYLKANRDKMVLGGAQLREDGKTRHGSVFVVNVANLAEAEAFSRDEPFRKSGLFRSVRISRMRRATWIPENAPATADGN